MITKSRKVYNQKQRQIRPQKDTDTLRLSIDGIEQNFTLTGLMNVNWPLQQKAKSKRADRVFYHVIRKEMRMINETPEYVYSLYYVDSNIKKLIEHRENLRSLKLYMRHLKSSMF